MRIKRHLRLVASFAAVAMLAVACGGDDTTEQPTGTDTGTGTETAEPTETAAGDGTLVFGTSADPVVLDGALVSDGETLRAIDQMFEGLVGLEPGGTEIRPLLATEWEASEDGLAWTFTLREGVTFHDGTEFNAAAVCFNFDRWYNFTGSFQNPDATYYWQTVFGGFATQDVEGVPEESLYESCVDNGDGTVTLNITSPSASFLSALALTNFTIASPTALQEFGADEGEVGDDGLFRPTGTYGTEHPVGTGPFMFESWTRGDRLVMARFDDYWGEVEGNIETLIFRPIAEGAARLQALQSGEIDGYDLVAPEDFETIESDPDLQLLTRPAFNIGYIGFTQTANEALQDRVVREAIMMTVNRQAVVDGFYAGQGEVAHAFMPPELFGYADDVTQYEFDPEGAVALLEEAGHTLPIQLQFAYPTDVSRPYMPNAQANAEAFAADLEAQGAFEVELVSDTWSPDYLGKAFAGDYELYLLGWTGDFGDPDNFLGTFFQTPNQPEWGFEEAAIHDILDEAESETDVDARTALYEEANRLIADYIPGVPYVHTQPALAFRANVTGYQPSPVSLEPFSLVTVS
ncbi:MAG: ABC transporter substrate-binding protein [Actinobacteria bacterium]|nr:ABC transporter substrate-binding protein [Actinomycetota bacterium]